MGDEQNASSKAVKALNAMSKSALSEELLRICGSTKWVELVAQAQPYMDVETLGKVMDEVWWGLSKADWLEAFRAHPRIGDAAALKKKFAAAAAHGKGKGGVWEADEQKGADEASEETLQALADWNVKYEERYGFIFLICATGKSALEMLQALQARMEHAPEDELVIAAGEQRKITHLRLAKLVSSLAEQESSKL